MKRCHFAQNHAVDASVLRAELSAEIPSFSRKLKSASVSNPKRREPSDEESVIAEDSLRHCGNGGGGGVCLAYGGVPDSAMADIGTQETHFEDNDALVGGNTGSQDTYCSLFHDAGGMFVSIAGNWSTGNETKCETNALNIEPCRLFHLFDSAFVRNTATFGAGGLFVTDPELVIVGCGILRSDIVNWKQLNQAKIGSSPLKDCFHFEDNSVLVHLRTDITCRALNVFVRRNLAVSTAQTWQVGWTLCGSWIQNLAI